MVCERIAHGVDRELLPQPRLICDSISPSVAIVAQYLLPSKNFAVCKNCQMRETLIVYDFWLGVRCVPAVVDYPTDISIIDCGVNDGEKKNVLV